MKKVLILTGETNSGKTSTLIRIIEECKKNHIKAAGILSIPIIKNKKKYQILAKDIVSEKEQLLATMENIPSQLKTGLYFFHKETFEWCSEIIKDNLEADVIIIDEIGRLELKKEGFFDIFDFIINNFEGVFIITVKKKLLNEVIREFKLQKSTLKETGKDKYVINDVLKTINRSNTHVCILGGGESKRMGINKAFVRFKGTRLIEHSYNTVTKITENISIAPGSLKIDGFKCLIDVKGHGPIAGLYAALLKNKRVLILPCDMPFMSHELLSYIIEQSIGYDITVPKVNNIIQMQTGVYSNKCIRPIEENIKNKQYSLFKLLNSNKLKVKIIEEYEIKKFGESNIMFSNINSPEDLKKAEKLIKNE